MKRLLLLTILILCSTAPAMALNAPETEADKPSASASPSRPPMKRRGGMTDIRIDAVTGVRLDLRQFQVGTATPSTQQTTEYLQR